MIDNIAVLRDTSYVMIDLDQAISEAGAKISALEISLSDWREKLKKLQEARAIALGLSDKDSEQKELASTKKQSVVTETVTLKRAALDAVVALSASGSWANVGEVAGHLIATGWNPNTDNFTTSLSTTLTRLAESGMINQRKDGLGYKQWRAKLE